MPAENPIPAAGPEREAWLTGLHTKLGLILGGCMALQTMAEAEALVAEVRRLTAERDAARQCAGQARCAYCHVVMIEGVRSWDQCHAAAVAHGLVCERSPMRVVEKERYEANADVLEIYAALGLDPAERDGAEPVEAIRSMCSWVAQVETREAQAHARAEAAERDRDHWRNLYAHYSGGRELARAERLAAALRRFLDDHVDDLTKGLRPRFCSCPTCAEARSDLAEPAPRAVVLDEQEARNVRVLIHNAPPLGVAQWCGPILMRINAAWPPVEGIDVRRPGPSTTTHVVNEPSAPGVWLTVEEVKALYNGEDAWSANGGSLRARFFAALPAESAPESKEADRA